MAEQDDKKEHWKRLFRHFVSAVASMGAAMGEGRVCQYAMEHCSRFIRGHEFAAADGGIYTGEALPLDDDMRLRIFQDYRLQKTIVPFDVKHMLYHHQKDNIHWSLDPSFVAMLPFGPHMGERSDYRATDGMTYRFPYTLHTPPPFPVEYGPYILPLKRLPEALDRIRQYAVGVTDHWVSPYNNITFPDWKRPRLFRPSCLESSQAKQMPGPTEMVDSIFEAFKNMPEQERSFDISRTTYVPYFGDLKLIQRATGIEVIVEVKKSQCIARVRRDGSVTAMSHSKRRMKTGDLLFSWKAQWDYMWTGTELSGPSGGTGAFLLPRDEVPTCWWNDLSETDMLRWPSDMLESLAPFYIRTGITDMVGDVERILNERNSRGLLKALRAVPIGPLPHPHSRTVRAGDPFSLDDDDTDPLFLEPDQPALDGLDDLDDAEEGSSTNGRSTPPRANFRVGYGSAEPLVLRNKSYTQWQAELLTQLCRQSRRGLILDMGKANTICQHAFADYEWSDADVAAYDERGQIPRYSWHFHPWTPMLSFTFLQMMWPAGFPGPVRSSDMWARRNWERPPSLVLCDALPPSCSRITHGLFLFPSTIIIRPTPDRGDFIESSAKYGAFTKCARDAPDPMDLYQLDTERIIPSILRFLTGDTEVQMAPDMEPLPTVTFCLQLKKIYEHGLNWMEDGEKV